MHIPVLQAESVKLWASLDRGKDVQEGIYVDATFGEGGHSRHLIDLAKEKQRITVVGIDQDQTQIAKAKIKFAKLIKAKKLFLYHDNFANLFKVISSFQPIRPVRGVLFDFGTCSSHLKANRGFSFQEPEAPLDMRFNLEGERPPAADILNRWPQDELEKLLKEKGEERYWRRAAKAIVEKRKTGARFEKVSDLLGVLEKVLASPYRKQPIHFATRVFQALRIAVNQEDENIKKGLAEALKILDRDGRIAAISFHSGEDRIVKQFFRQESRDCLCGPNLPQCVCNHRKSLQIITRKPLVPTAAEIRENPNSRSAKLRAAEKI